jgi:hypothetical protein
LNYLLEQDVTNGLVNVVVDWVTRFDHVAVTEFHGLRALTAQFARNDNLHTFGTVLHYVTIISQITRRRQSAPTKNGRPRASPNDTVTSATNSQATQQFVFKGFGLSDGTQSCSHSGYQRHNTTTNGAAGAAAASAVYRGFGRVRHTIQRC